MSEPRVRPPAPRWLALLSIVLAASACGDNTAPPVVEVSAGELRAVIEAAPARIAIVADGAEVWATTPGRRAGDSPLGFAGIGTLRADVTMAFGSFRFDQTPTPWRGVDRLIEIVPSDSGATFGLLSDGQRVGTGELSIVDARHVRLRLTSDVGDRVSLASTCTDGEHLVGLGGQSWDVDHRGQTVALWVQEDGVSKSEAADDDYSGVWFLSGRRHSTHTPMPMLLSSRGYALVVNTPARAVFALCSEADDVARFEAWQPELDLHLFIGGGEPVSRGHAVRDALGQMVTWVGKPPRPPAFAFAPWVDAILGQDNVERVAGRLRAEGIASSVIWTEDWRGGNDSAFGYALEEDWRVDPDLYPEFEQLAAAVHALGFKLLTYNNSFVARDGDVYAEASAGGHLVRSADGAPYLFDGIDFEPTGLVNLSSPAAVAWAQDVYAEGLALGADGWMADFGEWLPADAIVASGQDAALTHNPYPVEWARLHRDLLARQTDGVERLFFVRAAWLGSQPLVSVVWMGDQQTDFSPGDGMPSVIPMMIGLGITGFPFVGHDIAGYASQLTVPVTEELWYRWVTLGALSPVMRTHHGRDARENYNWESDPGATAHLRRWAGLHMQLLPYLWGTIGAFERDGLPLVRLIALDHPDDDWAWTVRDQYLLGDRILVAPVVEQGAAARMLHLPAGCWFPLLGGPPRRGGDEIEVTAAIDEIPAFVPAGTLLVLQPPGVDTVVDAAVPGVIQGDRDRQVWLWPGQPAGDAGTWHDEAGTAAEPQWRWTGRDERLGAPARASWNGASIELTEGATATVIGDGVLAFEGGGELTIARGDAGAEAVITLRAAGGCDVP